MSTEPNTNQDSDDSFSRLLSALKPYSGPLMMRERVDREPTNIEGAVRLREIIAELEDMGVPTDELAMVAREWEGGPTWVSGWDSGTPFLDRIIRNDTPGEGGTRYWGLSVKS